MGIKKIEKVASETEGSSVVVDELNRRDRQHQNLSSPTRSGQSSFLSFFHGIFLLELGITEKKIHELEIHFVNLYFPPTHTYIYNTSEKQIVVNGVYLPI
jgi:hypothetical protein